MTQPSDPAPRIRAQVRFAMVPEWILFHEELDPYDKTLYAVLQRYADADGACFPGRPLLARRAGMSERRVDACVAALEKAEALTRHRRWLYPEGGVCTDPQEAQQRHLAVTSNEYLLRVLPPLHSVQGGGQDVHPPLHEVLGPPLHSVRPNENHLLNETPQPPTGGPTADAEKPNHEQPKPQPTARRSRRAQARADEEAREQARYRDEQDRMALRGRFKPWEPPPGAIWSDEHDGWLTTDGYVIRTTGTEKVRP
jgi:hypothetical protein